MSGTGSSVAVEEARSLDGLVEGLVDLIADAVSGGSSIGFVIPFERGEIEEWWRSLSPEIEAGRYVLLLARDGERIVGTVQLRLAAMPNSSHRAEVAKLVVHRSARRRGVGRDLMRAIEDVARRERRTLLVLDTISESDAVHFYRAIGWTEAGSIPRYAAMPDGRLAQTTFFYRELSEERE